MDISLFDYDLPKDLIANSPAQPRDHSRLMVINRKTKKIEHKHFYDLPLYLNKNDVLVLNQTKVFPARFVGQKTTGAKIEVLLLEEFETGKWKALTKAGIKIDQKINFKNLEFTCIGHEDQIAILATNTNKLEILRVLDKFGITPIPPYIRSKKSERILRKTYQTVYAKEKGSVAAPTAGLHFTPELLTKIKNTGVQIEYVTLHLGLGTFASVKETDITKHKIHSEEYFIDPNTLKRLNNAKQNGKRIIAVGTTTTRVLESLPKSSGSTNIFIYPGYKFKFVDSLITNFHLPKSTLLALVGAFCGMDLMHKIYSDAIKNKYRFYSFGDASLII